jgi:hypothetical protein
MEVIMVAKMSREEIEKLLIQGQCGFGEFRVSITRNSALQYKAVIIGKRYNVVFQQYNDFNGLNWHLQQYQSTGARHGSLSFWEDLADWLYEHMYNLYQE